MISTLWPSGQVKSILSLPHYTLTFMNNNALLLFFLTMITSMSTVLQFII